MESASVTQQQDSTSKGNALGEISFSAFPFSKPSCQCSLPGLTPETPNVPNWWAGVPSPTLAVASLDGPVGGTVALRKEKPSQQANESGAVSSCLDLIETSEQKGVERRVGWGPLRRDSLKVSQALRAASEEGRAVRMEGCSREWMAYRYVPTRSVVLRSNRCRDRFCLVCMSLRSSAMVRRFDSILQTWPVVRMMTFTVRSSDDLRGQIGFLRHCFKELRRRRGWKSHVKGYLVTLEVTRSSAGWHAHLHVLYQGSFWQFNDLKTEWKTVTADEGSVDIRVAGSIKEALKYVVKPKALMNLGGEEMQQLIETMKGMRCLSTGGTLRGIVTEEELDDDDEMGLREEYEPIGRLDEIVERYRAGERTADVVDTIRVALKLGILEREIKPYGFNRRKAG